MEGYKEGAFTGTLEAEIDKHGLFALLISLECICGEKAGHIRANWQDKALARVWDKYSKRMGKLAREAEKELP